MIENVAGELAALGTACCWTVSAMSFELASKRVGSLSVNLIRLLFAFVMFSIYMGARTGWFLPLHASPHAWFWLSLSGIVGFALGDLFLFQAFVEIGSRISMLIMASVPILTALIGWFFLGETMTRWDLIGMFVTICGISLVVLERNPENDRSLRLKHSLRGILLACGGAAGQAIGLVLSKYGMEGHFDPFAATQIRVISGILGFGLILTVYRRWGRFRQSITNRSALIPVSLGSFFGPFLGVSLSLLAVQYTTTGVASTLIAIVPVLIIPPAIIIYKERVTVKEILGAIITICGVVFFFI